MNNSIGISIDLIEKTINFDVNELIAKKINVSVNKGVDLSSFNFNFTIKDASNSVVFQSSFPESGITLLKTDLDILKSFMFNFTPSKVYTLHIEYNYEGELNTSEIEYTAPKPKKPYESWIWQDTAWAAPVPLPADAGDITSGTMYEWNEQNLTWEPLGGYIVE